MVGHDDTVVDLAVHQPFQDEYELHPPVDLRVGLQTAFDPSQQPVGAEFLPEVPQHRFFTPVEGRRTLLPECQPQRLALRQR